MRPDAVPDLEAEDPRWATVLVRVEPPVLETIKAMAKEADRSIAAEIRRALRTHALHPTLVIPEETP